MNVMYTICDVVVSFLGGGDRSHCKMRMMFLCREVKLPIHCFKAVEMLERENSGSKLGN